MPTLVTTVEDFCPVIFYSGSGGGNWTAGTSSNDSSIDQYSGSSYMITQAANASLSFSFYGTGVQLYGAERADHGSYQVTIDSHTYPPANGKVNGTQELFQTAIFQSIALKNALHTVTVVNLGNTKFDLDFLTWQTSIGKDEESLLSFTNQDSDSSFKYTPTSSWTTNPPNIGSFNGGSGHVTSTAGAYVEYTFNGAAVAIYGPVGPQGAQYSVQLDNSAKTNYSSSKQFFQPQTMLFQAGGLSSGSHTIRLSSEAWNNSALTLGIDYAVVFSTPSLQHTPLATGSIFAIVLGILLAFSLIATGYLFFRRRRDMPVEDFTRAMPFSEVEYQSLRSQSEPSPGPLQRTSYASMQSSSTWSQVADHKIHPEVYSANAQVIALPEVLERKYRPDLSSMTLSSQEIASNSFTPQSSLYPRQGGSQPPGVAPPSYVVAQGQ